MTTAEKIAFKNQLKQTGRTLIQARINMAKAAIDNAQAAANSEEKSSAGDKYETGRAMGHLEKDMYAKQQSENIKELALLESVNTDKVYTTAQTGALVHCEAQSFFIAAGLGKQLLADHTIFFISPYTPLAKLLFGKKTGGRFMFNKQEVVILDVY
ncbi:MAG: hypothetical protein J7623_07265 [Chitinophaga sp.]|uniref:hypothetical protein n=1 Tax=Chitinophaga sp. TaxID=1869181 RepID=UPI001B253654|nr:hypothetical protein [Chitinophaga sp.]MBO9728423.1 hypothetical protein [Chitinophaga sp.]